MFPLSRRSLALLAASSALFLLGCTREAEATKPPSPGGGSGARTELAVYAATSARDALQSLELVYEKDQEVDLVFNFGSSGDLSKQIVAAAKADLFLSADDKEMDRVEQAGLLAAGTRRDLLANQLVVIEPVDGPSPFSEHFAPAQLAQPAVKRLSLANVETVPAGRYAKAWLENVGVWKDVADRVLPAVDVRAALAAVESGGAQAGVVYRTDLARSKKARLVFAVPPADGPRISYPVGIVAGRPSEAAARAFAEFLTSTQARLTFEQFGFVFLPPAKEARARVRRAPGARLRGACRSRAARTSRAGEAGADRWVPSHSKERRRARRRQAEPDSARATGLSRHHVRASGRGHDTASSGRDGAVEVSIMRATRHGEGDQALHPDAGEAWFLELPPDRQAELTHEWRARCAVWERLSRAGRRRLAIETAQTAIVFAVADAVCPRASFATGLLFALCGALNGIAGNRADLGQVRTSALGLASFFVLQLVTRDGLSVMQMMVCFPLGCACAYLGWRRSERAFD